MTTGLTRDAFRRHRTAVREVDAPASTAARFGKALLVGLVGATVYAVVLMVVAVAQGRAAWYPLRAIYAIFNGNRYLVVSDPLRPLGFGIFEGLKALVWVVTLGILVALPPALLTPVRVICHGRVRTWLAVGIGWSLVMFVLGFVVLGYPAAPEVQRSGSSYEGVRELGLWAFALAHVAYGAVLGLLLQRATRTKEVIHLP